MIIETMIMVGVRIQLRINLGFYGWAWNSILSKLNEITLVWFDLIRNKWFKNYRPIEFSI